MLLFTTCNKRACFCLQQAINILAITTFSLIIPQKSNKQVENKLCIVVVTGSDRAGGTNTTQLYRS